MADTMRMIDVPEVEPEAYNPDRPISGLIHTQLIHLAAAQQRLPPAKRTGVNIAMLHTEADAASYIQKVTAILHPQGAARTRNKAKSKTRAKTKIQRKGPGRQSVGNKKSTRKAGKVRSAKKSRR
jgi:hypothetical protein